MGKEFSKELQENAEVAQKTSTFKVEKAYSGKELAKVHKRVVEEYPYLKHVYEAMLVTDNRLPDNPIVFANDNFQKMTCYSREEIIGRNCRFLQGKYTDKETVRSIRKAVDNGLELDVELLNYRKDGVPFWNNFLMLPIHKKNPKKVKTGELNPTTHFIAIQKDVTVLKQGRSKPDQWKPVEVAFYLDFLGFGQYGEHFVSNSISGDCFLSLEDDDLKALGISEQAHRAYILKRIEFIKRDDSKIYDELKVGRIIQTSPNEIGEEDADTDTFDDEGLHSFSSDPEDSETPRENVTSYTSPPPNHAVNLDNPRLLQYWSQKPDYQETMCVKTYCEEEINLFVCGAKLNYKHLVDKVRSLYYADVKLKFKDEDGDFVSINDDGSLTLAKNQYQGRTLPVYVTRGDPVFPPSRKRRRASKSSSPSLAVHDMTRRILWANDAAFKLLKVDGKSAIRNMDFSTFFPNVDITGWKGKGKVSGRTSDQIPLEGVLSASSLPNHIYLVTFRLSS